MRFWDSSAVIPLLAPESTSRAMASLFEADPVMIAWWATDVECVSAISRQQRLGRLDDETANMAYDRLKIFRATWHEVEPTDGIRESAGCSACTTCERLTPCSWQQLSLPRKTARPRSNSFHSTSAF